MDDNSIITGQSIRYHERAAVDLPLSSGGHGLGGGAEPGGRRPMGRRRAAQGRGAEKVIRSRKACLPLWLRLN